MCWVRTYVDSNDLPELQIIKIKKVSNRNLMARFKDVLSNVACIVGLCRTKYCYSNNLIFTSFETEIDELSNALISFV